MRSLVVVLAFAAVAAAQYEKGHIKILQDKRYQEGGAFGNFRNQEDGIKYQEETDAQGIRRGFWEYPDETGKLLRVEFEAGPGIGFRVTNSNYLAATPVHNNVVNVARPQPAPKPVHSVPRAPVHNNPVHIQQAPLPVVRAALPTTTTPHGPIHIFDYPANLDFSRHAQGHSFKFTAA